MNDIATQQRFVQLRCEGWSFARIAEELRALSTGRLFYLAESLRRQISGITGPMQFSSPLRDIPADEYHEQVQDWVDGLAPPIPR